MIMKIKSLFLLAVFFSLNCFAQTKPAPDYFEGEILYANNYKSTNPQINEKQVRDMLGVMHNYFIKGGDYKTFTNGRFAQWQLYINKENRIYNKMANSDTVFWNNAAEHDDVVLSSKITKNAIVILGYPCDELVLVCKSGTHKYYFNSKLAVDAKLFTNHKYGNFYEYVSRAKAVPLKMILEDFGLTIESTATKIIPKKLETKFFQLDPGTKTAKSLY
jgi:hypothetical protein